MFLIMGKSRFGTEEIDSFDTLKEAQAMLFEYAMAFGHEWTLYVMEKENNG